MVKRELLRKVPFFSSLSDDETQAVELALNTVEFPPGEVIFEEGQPGDSFFILISGEIEIIKYMGTIDEYLLTVRKAGEFLGEMSLFDPSGKRTASVRTRTAASILKMTYEDFDALLHKQPGLAYAVASELSKRLSADDSAMICDLQEKNRKLTVAYDELKAAQAQIIEKEKLEHEMEMARTIQLSILPSEIPRLGGFNFYASMTPARLVGGDFFDFIPLGRGRLGLAIGDVSGKGMPAAIFMALTRSLLRAEARRRLAPDYVLRQVNENLLEMNEAGMFVTVLYGVLDSHTRQFKYARAGHELPLVLDGSGGVQTVSHNQGQPLGILPDPFMDVQTIQLLPGGAILLNTDGVTDATNPAGETLGMERLKEALGCLCFSNARQLCEEVFRTCINFQGSEPQFDDITMLAAFAEK